MFSMKIRVMIEVSSRIMILKIWLLWFDSWFGSWGGDLIGLIMVVEVFYRVFIVDRLMVSFVLWCVWVGVFLLVVG